VRADVAIGAGTEMYSWAGENHYVPAPDAIQFVDDRDSTQFLFVGAATIAGLSSLARIIFSDDNEAVFSYTGDEIQDGRTLSEFGFSVSPARSHLTFRIAGQQITAAYDGTVLVDATTEDLVRLVIRVAELAVCRHMRTDADGGYGRVHLEGNDFLMPEQVLTQLTKRDATQFENRATYSNWRSFRPQDAAAERLAPGAPSISQEPDIPSGFRFSIGLDQPIDTAAAAFGDRIHASLTSDMVDRAGIVLFPAGAAVDGRIIKVLRVYGKTESSYSMTILVRWETVTHNRDVRRFTARAENTTGLAGQF